MLVERVRVREWVLLLLLLGVPVVAAAMETSAVAVNAIALTTKMHASSTVRLTLHNVKVDETTKVGDGKTAQEHAIVHPSDSRGADLIAGQANRKTAIPAFSPFSSPPVSTPSSNVSRRKRKKHSLQEDHTYVAIV